jgi:hypothetical protein
VMNPSERFKLMSVAHWDTLGFTREGLWIGHVSSPQQVLELYY